MTGLPVGSTSRGWLEAVGVGTLEDLQALGAVETWKRAKAAFPDQVSVNLLYALQGALMGCAWNDLPPEMKEAHKRAIHG